MFLSLGVGGWLGGGNVSDILSQSINILIQNYLDVGPEDRNHMKIIISSRSHRRPNFKLIPGNGGTRTSNSYFSDWEMLFVSVSAPPPPRFLSVSAPPARRLFSGLVPSAPRLLSGSAPLAPRLLSGSALPASRLLSASGAEIAQRLRRRECSAAWRLRR